MSEFDHSAEGWWAVSDKGRRMAGHVAMNISTPLLERISAGLKALNAFAEERSDYAARAFILTALAAVAAELAKRGGNGSCRPS